MGKRRLFRISAAVLAVVGILALYGLHASQRAPADQGPHYTFARVSRGDIVQSVRATGQLAPLESVEVSSQISGLVIEVAVDFNSVVKKGQVLARIDPSTFEQKVRQAESDLEAAQAAYTLAKLNAERLKDLRNKDLVTQQEYDIVDAARQQAHAALMTRRSAVEDARVDRERCTITSPTDGVVIFKQIQVGKTVVSSFSAETLFVITKDLSKLQIVAPISEVDVWQVEPGQAATFTVDARPDKRFSGRVTQIRNPYTPSDKQRQQPQQQSATPMFDVVIEVDNSQLLLRPSFTANVSIAIAQRSNVLRFPNAALRAKVASATPATVSPEERSASVYRVQGVSQITPPEAVVVRLGASDGIMTEAVSGLSDGDMLVTGVATTWENERPRSFF